VKIQTPDGFVEYVESGYTQQQSGYVGVKEEDDGDNLKPILHEREATVEMTLPGLLTAPNIREENVSEGGKNAIYCELVG